MGAIDITQVLEHYGPSFQPHTQHDVIVTKLICFMTLGQQWGTPPLLIRLYGY